MNATDGRAWGSTLSPDGEPQVMLALDDDGAGQPAIDVQYSHDGDIIDGDASMPPAVFEDFLMEGVRLLLAADPSCARRLAARLAAAVSPPLG